MNIDTGLIKTILHFAAAICLVVVAAGVHSQEAAQESRIDFGNAYIQGQSIKSGAIYLTNRRKSQLQSLLKTRKNYRYEIVKDFYGGEVELEDPTVEPQPIADQQTDK